MTPGTCASRADHVPSTPLLDYFRSTFVGPRGRAWAERRLTECRRLLSERSSLGQLFDESVTFVEQKYRNYQPFYPTAHTFGFRGSSGIRHGESLQATVDVAARLAKRETWEVAGDRRLDFRYLDRELALMRARPRPTSDPGSILIVDLFLANARDRTPILAEVKLRRDQCAFYALIQLLTQAAYAVSRSQRERLVLFGSRPDFVLAEAVGDVPGRIDLYLILVERVREDRYEALLECAVAVSKTVMADARVRSRVRRIAWINGVESGPDGLALDPIAVVPA